MVARVLNVLVRRANRITLQSVQFTTCIQHIPD